MMKERVISLFLGLLMTVQMVPVAQIDGMQCSNQWTEELPHSCEQSSKGDVTVNNSFLPPEHHMLVTDFCDAKTLKYLHISDLIPSNHSTDVVSPPPDVLA